MSQRGSKQSSAQFGKGLSYNTSLPPFLQRLHAAAGDTSSRSNSARSSGRGISGFDDLDEDERPSIVDAARPGGSESEAGGRASIPTRPKEGRWAGGSDDECPSGKSGMGNKGRAPAGNDEDEGDDDEWEKTYGGGGEDGPQIVVLKEGKHMTQAQVDDARDAGSGKKRKRAGDETDFPTSVKLPSTRASIADKSSSLLSSLPSAAKSRGKTEPQTLAPESNATTPNTPTTTALNNTAGAKRRLAELALEKERKAIERASAGKSGTTQPGNESRSGKLGKKESSKSEKGNKGLLSFGEEEE